MKLVDRMPAFPNSVHRILQLTADINFSAKELIRIIDHDPVMTVKILKLVNSAYFGLSRKITTIHHAVVFVGINTIKNLAVSIATLGMLPQNTRSGLNMTRFLLHSLGTAAAARLLGLQQGLSEEEATNFFVAGLLHDFGKVVFSQFLPGEHQSALKKAAVEGLSLEQTERAVIGADHAELGALLAEKWQLPPLLVATIREHHRVSGIAEEPVILQAVFTANQIAKFAQFGDSGNPVVAPLPPRVAERFGGEVVELVHAIPNLFPEMEKMRLFIAM